MTLSEAYLELLDHLGEKVHVGILLPGRMPWAGCYGTLRHEAQRLLDTREVWTAALLRQRGIEGRFLVGDFVIPLDAGHATAATRIAAGDHPGLDFAIVGGLTVRMTFAEHVAQSRSLTG